MALSAQDVFAMQLARGAGKKANRFLYARGLQKADRDDVISAALLWCWENRANYSLTTTLETWFMNAVRNAYQSLRRGALPVGGDLLAEMSDGDKTFNSAAAQSAAEVLIGALTPAGKEIASLTMQGYSRREMMARGHSKQSIDDAHKRIRQLRRLQPDYDTRAVLSRDGATDPAPNPDEVTDQLSGIDMEIQALDFPPPAGKDCPPCWRCMWFEGFMPAGKRDTRMDIEDIEVREAVKNTEARKIEIAQQVRSGL
jgi:hypothetical protein